MSVLIGKRAVNERPEPDRPRVSSRLQWRDEGGILLCLVAVICLVAVFGDRVMLSRAREMASQPERRELAEAIETRRIEQMDMKEIRAERRRGLIMLRSDDRDLQVAGLKLLGTFGDTSVESDLLRVLKTESNPQLWRHAELALVRIWSRSGDPEVDKLLSMASEVQQAGSPMRAAHMYTAAINRAPGFAHAYMRRSRCYFNLGEYDKAVRDAERAVELNPNDFAAMMELATTYMFVGRLSEAEQVLTRILDVNPHVKRASAMLESIRARLADEAASGDKSAPPPSP